MNKLSNNRVLLVAMPTMHSDFFLSNRSFTTDFNNIKIDTSPGLVSIGSYLKTHGLEVLIADCDSQIYDHFSKSNDINQREISHQHIIETIENVDPEIKKGVRFIIYEGEKKGRPSQIVDLVKGTGIRKR